MCKGLTDSRIIVWMNLTSLCIIFTVHLKVNYIVLFMLVYVL